MATVIDAPAGANLLQGATGPWEVVIGLEVHAQVVSNAKLFSAAPTEFGGAPNSHVALLDAGLPGTLPVLNRVCVEQAVRTGLGLEAQINKVSVFERKNYFYPDLPLGYQISQYQHPIVGVGVVHVDLPDGTVKEVGIVRLHLEMDAGKSLHDQRPDATLVDLNRAGVALMEIVSEPDLRSAEEAVAYLRKLRSILRYLGTCDGNMEQGNLRCDANVSVRRPGANYGTRCEVKNLNSMRFMARAIEFEARRQIDLIEAGGTVEQERHWDEDDGRTHTLRSKEEAHDYRYFPDPDLLPLVLDDTLIARLKADLPELPDAKKARLMRDFGLSPYDASVLVAEQARAAYYEQAQAGHDPKLVANWLISELLGRLNKDGRDIQDSPVAAPQLGALVGLIQDGTISGRTAKEVFDAMFETGQHPTAIVDAKGLRQISDTGALDAVVAEVLAANPDKVADYQAGKTKLLGFFVGQVMKATQGKANPKSVNAILAQKLDG
jgi:aspartyl-tRNA(Asn)/glutamyl-tRNA(Gln) amidotransferase subunit B